MDICTGQPSNYRFSCEADKGEITKPKEDQEGTGQERDDYRLSQICSGKH